MFGISPLGWLHTLGSLPAIPAAIYMLARYGRIEPASIAGRIYLIAMIIGSLSVFLVAKQPISNAIAVIALGSLLVGYGVSHIRALGRAARYIETISLSFSVLILMVPTVTETLTRVPNGNPILKSLDAPLLKAAQGSLLVLFLIGVTLQVIALRRGAGAKTAA